MGRSPWGNILRMRLYEIVRDVLSLLLAALASYLAWLAIRMGKRQGEIAEMQHQIMQEQLAKKGELQVFLVGPDVREGFNVYPMMAVNGGRKTVAGFHWDIWISDMTFVRVLDGREGREIAGEPCVTVGQWEEQSRKCGGFYQVPVFYGTPVQFATVLIDYTVVPADTDHHVSVQWIATTEDERIEGQAPDNMNGFHVVGSAKRVVGETTPQS
jgi:hypothetical protein